MIIIMLFVIGSPTILQLTGSNILATAAVPVLLFLLIMYYLSSSKLTVNAVGGILLILFVILMLLASSANNNSSWLIDSKVLLIYYISSVFMIMLSFLSGIGSISTKDDMLNLFVHFALLEAILGIIQFILKNPILPVIIDGKQVVSSIYYIPGSGGTGDMSRLMGSYFIRASGSMGSGLGLGLLLLSALAVSESHKKNKYTWVIRIILSSAIILTLTGVVYIGFLTFLILQYIILKKSPKTMLHIYDVIWGVGVTVQILINYLPQNIIDGFPTVASRITGIQYYLSALNFNVRNIIFGQNFTNTWANYSNAVTNVNQRYVVDNYYMYTFFNIGIAGLLILYIAYRLVIIKQLKDGGTTQIIPLQLSVMIIGFGNNVTSAMSITAIIALFLITNSKLQNIERENN